MKNLWLAAVAALQLSACASAQTTAPATTASEAAVADPNAPTITTSGSVEVGVRSSTR
jgi:uncharacterized lipoprotein YmbA